MDALPDRERDVPRERDRGRPAADDVFLLSAQPAPAIPALAGAEAPLRVRQRRDRGRAAGVRGSGGEADRAGQAHADARGGALRGGRPGADREAPGIRAACALPALQRGLPRLAGAGPRWRAGRAHAARIPGASRSAPGRPPRRAPPRAPACACPARSASPPLPRTPAARPRSRRCRIRRGASAPARAGIAEAGWADSRKTSSAAGRPRSRSRGTSRSRSGRASIHSPAPGRARSAAACARRGSGRWRGCAPRASARQSDRRAEGGTSRARRRARGRPARRPPPGPGCAVPEGASAPPAFAPSRVGSPPSLHLADGAHLDAAVAVEDGAAARQLHRLVQVLGADQEVAADQVLGLGIGPVGHHLLAALDHLAFRLERFAGLEVAGLAQLLDPSAPLLELLLHLLRARTHARSTAEYIEEVRHVHLSSAGGVPALLSTRTIGRSGSGQVLLAGAMKGNRLKRPWSWMLSGSADASSAWLFVWAERWRAG